MLPARTPAGHTEVWGGDLRTHPLDDVTDDMAERRGRPSGWRRPVVRVVAVVALVAIAVLRRERHPRAAQRPGAPRARPSTMPAGWGPLLFVGLMVLLVPLNVPGLVFVDPRDDPVRRRSGASSSRSSAGSSPAPSASSRPAVSAATAFEGEMPPAASGSSRHGCQSVASGRSSSCGASPSCSSRSTGSAACRACRCARPSPPPSSG